jgi:hypothetical protein
MTHTLFSKVNCLMGERWLRIFFCNSADAVGGVKWIGKAAAGGLLRINGLFIGVDLHRRLERIRKQLSLD